jgi:hypothetical protein
MSVTHARPALAAHRDAVTEQIQSGRPFGDVEDAIDALEELTPEQKAALWLVAFSHRDRAERKRDARAYLCAVG